MIDDTLVESLTLLRKNLQKTIDFLNIEMAEDLVHLREWKMRYGDLYFRPDLGNGQFGNRTSTVLEPIASQFRATIKSLLDSIYMIESKLIVQTDDPTNVEGKERKENDLMEKPVFDAKAVLAKAKATAIEKGQIK